MSTRCLHALRSSMFFLAFIVLENLCIAQSSSIDSTLAQQYFSEAQTVCSRDGGKLWGISLCGPILFVDPQTLTVITNQPAQEGNLKREGNVFLGRLPQTMNIANTATDWAGIKWAMILWPLPENKYDRTGLLAHESWHRIQKEIGLSSFGFSSMPSNNHLDSLEGRIWLQLEWRALRQALTNTGAKRRRAVEDALLFRSYRRELFPKSDSEERALEMNEGLAEYTGIKLSGRPDSADHIASQLKEAEKKESFVRSFAYPSGAAYGILLDEAGKNWRKDLKPENDLGSLLQEALSLRLRQNLEQEAAKASKNYNGDALRRSEIEREERRQELVANYRKRFVESPVLLLPLKKTSMQFDQNNMLPLASFGTVYANARIVDEWGILTVSKGAVINLKVKKAYVTAPLNPNIRPLQGDGWILELNPEWTIVPGERKGDYVIKKSE